MNRAQKFSIKLGGSGSLDEMFPEKPKGMHWKTYRRLKAIDMRGIRLWNRLADRWLDALPARTRKFF